MKLNYKVRSTEKKKETKRIKRSGQIPAILYSKGKQGTPIMVDTADFNLCLERVKKGHLPTTKFSLVAEDGKEISAIVKDIQYHVTTYEILHLDFEQLNEKVHVNVKVPIECEGVVDCVGIKLGGVLRQVIRYLKVNCLPKDIPESFKLDVKNLKIKESLRLSDIQIADGIRPLADLHEVAVAIVKR